MSCSIPSPLLQRERSSRCGLASSLRGESRVLCPLSLLRPISKLTTHTLGCNIESCLPPAVSLQSQQVYPLSRHTSTQIGTHTHTPHINDARQWSNGQVLHHNCTVRQRAKEAFTVKLARSLVRPLKLKADEYWSRVWVQITFFALSLALFECVRLLS